MDPILHRASLNEHVTNSQGRDQPASISMSICPLITTAQSMESVLWLRGVTPISKRTTLKIVPWSRVVMKLLLVGSSKPLLLTGKPWLDHTTLEVVPGAIVDHVLGNLIDLHCGMSIVVVACDNAANLQAHDFIPWG
jgi:hypothetical protein